MPTFETSSQEPRLTQAITTANAAYADAQFRNAISQIEDFDHANLTGAQLVDLINQNNSLVVKVRTYNNSNTNATAYFTSREPDSVFINLAKINRCKASIVNTLIHESLHLIDNRTGRYEFGHAGNDRTGKDNTAPYAVGYLAYIHAKKTAPTAKELISTFNSIPAIFEGDMVFIDKAPDPDDNLHLVKNFSLSINPAQLQYRLQLTFWDLDKGHFIPFSSFKDLKSIFDTLLNIEDMEIKVNDDGSVTFEL